MNDTIEHQIVRSQGKIAVCLILLGCLFFQVSFAQCNDEQEYNKAFQNAQEFMEQKKFEKAFDNFNTAKTICPQYELEVNEKIKELFNLINNEKEIAEAHEKEAQLQKQNARKQRDEALKALERAKEAELEAQLQKQNAKKAELEARRQRDEALDAKKRVEEEKERADKALQLAMEKIRETIDFILEQNDKFLMELKYENALVNTNKLVESLRGVRDFNQSDLLIELSNLSKSIGKHYPELAFWYTETHQYAKAQDILEKVLNLNPNPDAQQWLKKATQKGKERQFLNKCLTAIDKKQYKELQKRYYPQMIDVEGGKFWMGCDSKLNIDCGSTDQHEENIENFAIAATETTVFQFALYCQAAFGDKWEIENEYRYMDGVNIKGDSLGVSPVSRINWHDSMRYVEWLNKQKGETQETLGKDYRLPTEAEWEYAARGGKNPSSFLYAGSDSIEEVAWYLENSNNMIHPVGSKKSNAIGLYDMTGNVFEWCFDKYHIAQKKKKRRSRKKKQQLEEKEYRVLRGGDSYRGKPELLYVFYRGRNMPEIRAFGFRVAYSL